MSWLTWVDFQMEMTVAETRISSTMSHAKSLTPEKTYFFTSQFLLRILAVVFPVVAISVMVNTTQTIVMFGFTFEARYSYTSVCRFLFLVDVLVCVFSALSLVLMILMIPGCAAATAVGYVAQYGEDRAVWVAVCDRVVRFCNKMLVSVVFSYLAFLVYLFLTVMATLKLMSAAK